MIVDEFGRGGQGDLGVATTPGTGCGVVLGNVTSQAAAACDRLGLALARAYMGATLPSGQGGAFASPLSGRREASTHARSDPTRTLRGYAESQPRIGWPRLALGQSRLVLLWGRFSDQAQRRGRCRC